MLYHKRWCLLCTPLWTRDSTLMWGQTVPRFQIVFVVRTITTCPFAREIGVEPPTHECRWLFLSESGGRGVKLIAHPIWFQQCYEASRFNFRLRSVHSDITIINYPRQHNFFFTARLDYMFRPINWSSSGPIILWSFQRAVRTFCDPKCFHMRLSLTWGLKPFLHTCS